MKIKDNTIEIFKIVIIDIIGEVVYFPLWWYSSGVYRTGLYCLKKIKDQWYNMGLSINLKFLFKPMYAQKDFAGRLISFFIRLIQLIFKIIVFFVFVLIFFILFLAWIILPIVVVWQIIINYKFLRDVK